MLYSGVYTKLYTVQNRWNTYHFGVSTGNFWLKTATQFPPPRRPGFSVPPREAWEHHGPLFALLLSLLWSLLCNVSNHRSNTAGEILCMITCGVRRVITCVAKCPQKKPVRTKTSNVIETGIMILWSKKSAPQIAFGSFISALFRWRRAPHWSLQRTHHARTSSTKSWYSHVYM